MAYVLERATNGKFVFTTVTSYSAAYLCFKSSLDDVGLLKLRTDSFLTYFRVDGQRVNFLGRAPAAPLQRTRRTSVARGSCRFFAWL